MRPDAKKLVLIAMLMLTGLILVAQTFTYRVTPGELKPGERGTVRVTMSIPAGKHQSHNPQDNEYFKLNASHPDLVFGKTQYPAAHTVVSPEQWDYHGSVTLSLPFTVKANAAPGNKTINVSMDYGLCFDTGQCEPPELAEGSVRLVVAAANPDQPVSNITEEPAAPETVATATAIADSTTEQENAPAEPAKNPVSKILWYLLLAFVGGVIMNFTPCVLPVLTIRAMSIVNQAAEDKSKIFKHSMAYALGVLVSFIALAIVFIILKLAGESVGWGFQFQSVSFTIALTSIIFVFALALLDVFIISPPGMTAATQASAKKGVSGSFFGGVFAFLLATPCSAPLLGTAVGFAFGLPAWLMLIFFALVGIGLAFPFILIGLSPKALKIIPKPGEWMNIFKEVMAFVLLWIVYTMLKSVLKLTDGDYLLHVIMFILSLGFAAWLYGRFVRPEHSKATQWIFTLLTLVIIVGAALIYLPYKEAAVVEEAGIGDGLMRPAKDTPAGWYDFSPALMEKLLAEDAPVFVDFGAVWCKNCQANEKNVLFTDDIMAAFKAKGVILIHGDYTKQNPDMLDFMKKHGRVGVPFNVLYVKGAEPRLFSELLSKGMILDALKDLPEVSK